ERLPTLFLAVGCRAVLTQRPHWPTAPWLVALDTLSDALHSDTSGVPQGLWLGLRAIKRRNGSTCCAAWAGDTCGESERSFCDGRLLLGLRRRQFWRSFFI